MLLTDLLTCSVACISAGRCLAPELGAPPIMLAPLAAAARARVIALAALPLYTSGSALRRSRLASLHMQVGGAFPSSDRWQQHIVSEASTAAVPVLVLPKDECDEWLAAQSDEQRAYLAAAGLSKFKDDGLVLLPERRWAFLTANASSLFAFSSLPSRLPTDAVYELQSSLPLPPTAALSWGLGCYSFDACKGTQARATPSPHP